VNPRVRLEFAVPSSLAERLHGGHVDAALVPVVDLAFRSRFIIVSDACIASDGETLTVRVFTRVPPDRVRCLAVDGDSHTSIILAQLIWLELFGHRPNTIPLSGNVDSESQEAVLLIGDKVVSSRPRGFVFEMDLGAAWREQTGLPFVYAVWATTSIDRADDLAALLSASRDEGMSRLDEIAAAAAPAAGWPTEIARRYFREYLEFRLTDRHRQGMELFLRKAADAGLLKAAGTP